METRAEQSRRWRAEHPGYYKAICKKYREKNREKLRESRRRYVLNNSEKTRAGAAVRHAVAEGKLIRQPCEQCGSPNAHAHHEDYSKPMEVTWLCGLHHNQLHVKRKAFLS